MVIAQHGMLTGGPYVERPVSPELQEALDAADAALPPELRRHCHVVARDEIKTHYPDHWIALLPTHVDEHNILIAGRLIAHAEEWAIFDSAVQAFRRKYPETFPFTYYTGRYPMGRDVVHV
jgi:hypothetical protein